MSGNASVHRQKVKVWPLWPMLELDLDLVQMNVHTKFGDPGQFLKELLSGNASVHRQKVKVWPLWPWKIGQGHPCQNSSKPLSWWMCTPSLVTLGQFYEELMCGNASVHRQKVIVWPLWPW